MAEKEYIDRRIVLKAFSHRISELSDEPIVIGMNEALSLAEEFVENIPAADVAPVKHSKWEICCDGYYPYCKNCGKEPQGGAMTDYCPNCGARMDEVEHDT